MHKYIKKGQPKTHWWRTGGEFKKSISSWTKGLPKELSPNWKGGKPFCSDCGKRLSNYHNKKCSHCAKKGLFKGEKNPNWRDGISKLPYHYTFTEELKSKIRKRDNYICQLCGMTEEEHIIVYGQYLCIHHIDYKRINCQEDNLISVCRQCNSRVNFNREYWKEFFIKKMENKNVCWKSV